MKKLILILLTLMFFSFQVKMDLGSGMSTNNAILSLYNNSNYVLRIQAMKIDNAEQWSQGYTDYHVECSVVHDYKGSYNSSKVIFHHRVKGASKEEILHEQVSLGKEYIVFLGDNHTTISEAKFINGAFEKKEKEVYVLTDNYEGVIPFSLATDVELKNFNK